MTGRSVPGGSVRRGARARSEASRIGKKRLLERDLKHRLISKNYRDDVVEEEQRRRRAFAIGVDVYGADIDKKSDRGTTKTTTTGKTMSIMALLNPIES